LFLYPTREGEALKVAVDAQDIRMQLGNNGIVLYISDNSNRHVGKLRIGQAMVEWCPGKTRIGNGKKMRLKRFVDDVLSEMK
jgi:hypothetical protein